MKNFETTNIVNNVRKCKEAKLAELVAFKQKLKSGDWLSLNEFGRPLHCENADYKFFAGVKYATVHPMAADWTKRYHENPVCAITWVDSAIAEMIANM